VSDNQPHFIEIRRLDTDPSRGGYDALYTVSSLSKIESFYLWYLDQMHLPAGTSLLDVSCGAAELVRLARDRGLAAVGIDISPVVLHLARRRVQMPVPLAVADGEHLPFADSSFDFVSNVGSLEHFEDPALGVREMARVLRPGGLAFVLLPNTFGLLTTILNAYRQGVTSIDEQPIQRYGARADWERLLIANGLQVRRTAKYEQSWPRSIADWGYYRRRPKDLFRLIASPLVPLNLASCFVFTCEHRAE
jgi:ubiquinone/menaquinone biosynthesis C-methylase UbiE